jgi:hypothetical protein
MFSMRTRFLAASACFFGGILAGITANRFVVEFPSWQRVGLLPWANYIREETSYIGPFFYSAIGLLAILLTIAAATSIRFETLAPTSTRYSAYSAAFLAIVYATITRVILVPAMVRLKSAGDDPIVLQQIFGTAKQWSGINDMLHIAAISISLWVFAKTSSNSLPRRTRESTPAVDVR